MKNDEMIKLFDFILANRSIIISDKGLFSRDTLMMIRAIIKGKVPNNFKLTKEQEKIIVNAFINSNNTFNKDTPKFIIENLNCVKLALSRNINSIYYIENIPSYLQKYIIKEALRQGFILKADSPKFLKENYQIALNSINKDCLSANFIDWDFMKKEEIVILVEKAIEKGYILSPYSHSFLSDNEKIVLASIKKDKNTIRYASHKFESHRDVFEYLILNDYDYNHYDLRRTKLDHFSNIEVLGICLRKLDRYSENKENEQYISKINRLHFDAINIPPTIKTFESVFQYLAEEAWKEYRSDNFDIYNNIFGKICAELRNSKNIKDAIDNLNFLSIMRDTLDEKYRVLHDAMVEYFNIYHSNVSNKLEKMEKCKYIIVSLAALYVSKAKENYKKEILELYYDELKENFILKLENPYVNKKVIYAQRKDHFSNLYVNNDIEVLESLDKIAKNYSKYINADLIWKMIDNFLYNDYSKIDQFIVKPHHYDDYERYEKAIKLIRRLNSGYIKYDGVEVFNYKDLISLDERKEKYIYNGISFSENDLNEYNEYRKKLQIFEKIKKEITLKIKTMNFDTQIDYNLIEQLSSELPFNDEYFKFDSKRILSFYDLDDLIRHTTIDNYLHAESFTTDELFKNIYDILINNGLLWLLMLRSHSNNHKFNLRGFSRYTHLKIINNIRNITLLANEFKLDITDFKELLLAYKISNCADNKAMAILGKEIIEKLYKYTNYTDANETQIVAMAKELICQMSKRDKSTVPYVNGKTMDYKYSLYDSQDETILLSGINTDACFRIDGNDNDFLHYCALDKNGFVIKITDTFGNFIARASGFRNGNCVFINQLRTIYDEGGNFYTGIYSNEKNDIIEIFKKACQAIVDTSQKNLSETNKIDFVFVTQSYSLDDYESNVSCDVELKIGRYPMDTDSDDWKQFVCNTNNLQESKEENNFTTDYGEYPLICMASSKEIESINPDDIKKQDVPALYERTRNKIIVTNTPDINVYQKINKISAIKSFFDDSEFMSISIPETALTFVGDNWYIIYNNDKIINSCLLSFDEKAKIEFEATKQILSQYQQQLDYEQILKVLQMQNPDDYVKILKLRKKKQDN